MTRTVKKIFLSIFLFILIVIIGVVIPNLYNSNSMVDLKDKCYDYLTYGNNDYDFDEYRMIMKMMYPKPTFGIKYVNRNIDYEIIERERKKEIVDEGTIFEEVKYYNKVKIKVTSYNYALAYKNAVTSTNKYIKENENANNDEIEKYFANRLEYEGGKIIENNEKTVMYVFKKEEVVYGDGHNRGLNKTVIRKLPEQKDNLDFLNAMLGGLVEEMDKTKLPKGVDLEETLQLMEIE
ncbi:hypothetical protein [Anaerofustis sp. NSJ-163]|uniref:hypothetical protein n=1 Tax=Anaerofustis sp. NSJ-163 TaxID=2944391 RepID=UPI00209C2970|nr:hypothetical protein [Anaerofustis sp. NSJ-163]MCO8193013.1 hypothetical protein [Anaerofustis sp. NSJ-163]